LTGCLFLPDPAAVSNAFPGLITISVQDFDSVKACLVLLQPWPPIPDQKEKEMGELLVMGDILIVPL
jgi:hypothetical protein